MKKLLVFTLLLLGLGVPKAYADFEAIELVLGRLEVVQKKAQNVQEKLKDWQAELNETRQGVYGTMGQVVTKIDSVKNIDVKSIDSLSGVLEKGNIKELEEAVENEIVANYGSSNQNKTFNETKDKIDAVRREDLSRLYAQAFTLRTNMMKELNNPPAIEADKEIGQGREALQAAVTEANMSARRMISIWDMQSSVSNLSFTSRLLGLKKDVRNQEQAETEDGGEK